MTESQMVYLTLAALALGSAILCAVFGAAAVAINTTGAMYDDDPALVRRSEREP